ncbi:MAG TPA: c-type cytochrome domain-containing protein [Chitinophagaceae bacterium]|nr:c-type cytochrome domain-containing protein [Chitinophagaceae bacterium]
MEFFGRLHPLLVHLPIGILVIGLILYWWQSIDRSKDFSAALKPIFLLGTVAAVASCITGLVLADGGDYDGTAINRHRNTGIALAVISIYFWYLVSKNYYGKRTNYISYSILIALLVTGHYGASLTHGSGFLFEGSSDKAYLIKPVANVQEALVYQDVINPIMQQKCVSCHGADKQKGKLRLDTEEFIKKGGKNGEVIKGKEEAELLNRILLPPDDEDHMPPKEKGQLTKDQLALIKWWINSGASFTARVKEVPQDAAIKTSLVKLQGEQGSEVETTVMELPEVDAAPAVVIEQLKNSGIVVVPLAEGSNLLQLNLLNMSDAKPETWAALSKLSKQAWTLKADQVLVDNKAMASLGELKNLRKLSLSGASINDSAIVHLLKLSELESLNLQGTGVTADGLMQLATLKKLRALYLYDTKLDSNKVSAVRAKLPQVELIALKYEVPIFNSDTTTVK